MNVQGRESHKHLKVKSLQITLVLGSLLATSLVVVLMPLSSVLGLSEEEKKTKHENQILSIAFCRAV